MAMALPNGIHIAKTANEWPEKHDEELREFTWLPNSQSDPAVVVRNGTSPIHGFPRNKFKLNLSLTQLLQEPQPRIISNVLSCDPTGFRSGMPALPHNPNDLLQFSGS